MRKRSQYHGWHTPPTKRAFAPEITGHRPCDGHMPTGLARTEQHYSLHQHSDRTKRHAVPVHSSACSSCRHGTGIGSQRQGWKAAAAASESWHHHSCAELTDEIVDFCATVPFELCCSSSSKRRRSRSASCSVVCNQRAEEARRAAATRWRRFSLSRSGRASMVVR